MITPPTQEGTSLESMPSKPDFEPAPGFPMNPLSHQESWHSLSDVPRMLSSDVKFAPCL